jgi:nucleotide-binding universal stress UspA family protein
MDGKNYLVVLSNTRHAPKAIKKSVDLAASEGAGIIAAYVVDEEIPQSVSSWLIYVGFIGEKPVDEVKEALQKEYTQRAEAALEEIGEASRSEGVACTTQLLKGNMVEECLKLVEEHAANLIILHSPEEAEPSRLVFNSMVNELMKQAECPVEVLDEDRL